MATNPDTIISLLDTITDLHPDERAALDLLAVMYAPVARSPFAQCLQKIGIKSAQGKAMTLNDVPPLMAKLIGSNLAVEIDGSYCCNPQISHSLVRLMQKEGLFERYAQAVQSVIAPRESWHSVYYRSYALCVQDIRIALYRGLESILTGLFTICATNYPQDFRRHHPFSLICPEPLDTGWLLEMPASLRMTIISYHLDRSLVQLQPSDTAFGLLEQLLESRTEQSVDTVKLYLTQLLLRGYIGKAAAIMDASPTFSMNSGTCSTSSTQACSAPTPVSAPASPAGCWGVTRHTSV